MTSTTRRRGSHASCARCGAAFYRFPSDADRRYCSARCGNLSRRRYQREVRICASCGASFTWTPRPRSNSSGHYCSRRCRDDAYRAMAPADAVRGRRPRWRSARRAFMAAGNDFCVGCGARDRRLDVHHVEPYRLSRDDRPRNLVSACRACHRPLDRLADLIAAERRPERRAFLVAVVQAALHDAWHLHQGRRIGVA